MKNKFFARFRIVSVMLLSSMICVQLCSCHMDNGQTVDSLSEKNVSADIPKEYVECLENFLEAMKVSTEESAEYAYFPDETIKQAHKDSGITLVSYSVETAEKINNTLYAFNLTLEDTYTPGEPYEQWKFVGEIDGELLVIGNVNYIPEELMDNADKEKYEFKNADTLFQNALVFDLE